MIDTRRSSSYIGRLHIQNFRRFANVELIFDQEDQLIAILGGNSRGKSTILEAIIWILTGETKHRTRGQDYIIRKGSELEGTSGVLEMMHGGHEVRIERVRNVSSGYGNKAKVTAVLRVDGIDVANTSAGVSQKVAEMLGLDARGLRLAVYAQQNELDGLAGEKAEDRYKVLSRLLRLDQIDRARIAAEGARTDARRQLGAMDEAKDVETLEKVRDQTAADLEAAKTSTEVAISGLKSLDEEIVRGRKVEEQWADALEQRSRAEALIGASKADVRAKTEALSAIEVIELPPTPSGDLGQLTAELQEVERDLAAGEERIAAKDRIKVMEKDFQSVSQEIVSIEEKLRVSPLAAVEAQLVEVEVSVGAIEIEELETNGERVNAAEKAAESRARGEDLKRRSENLSSIGAVCDRCEQPIDENHRHAQLENNEAELNAQRTIYADAVKVMKACDEKLTSLHSKKVELVAKQRELTASRTELTRLSNSLPELLRRQRTYKEQLDNFEDQDINMDELYTKRGQLTVSMAEMVEYQRLVTAHATSTANLLSAERALREAQDMLLEREAGFAATEPAEELSMAYEEQNQRRARRESEIAKLTELKTAVAGLTERLRADEGKLVEAQGYEETRRGRREAVTVAEYAATVLSDVLATMRAELRPTLANSIGEYLDAMSGGRFSEVEVTPLYDIKIKDGDRGFVPVSEVSGGDRDLVALATRLALSSLVANRPGTAPVGFIALDEVFGSSDATRRGAIIEQLRAVKDSFGQIFIITHIPGMEDEVDKVLEVLPSGDAESEVSVL